MMLRFSIVVCMLLSTLPSIQAQIEFDVCIPGSWVGGGTGEITLMNTGSTLPAGSTLELNWPGITSIAPWSGFTVSGSNPYLLTFTNPVPAGGSLGPLGFSFTSTGSYFTPGSGTLNGSTTVLAVSPPCYIPPSYQNTDCQIAFSGLCSVPTGTAGLNEIQLGEGTVHAWNATKQVYVPENRKNWAIGMAVAHSLFTNLLGDDLMSINEYFATALQETNCGCDGSITEPAWVTIPYPDHENTNSIYCFDYTHGVAVGFFQEEYGTGWLELNQDIPCFIPTFNFDSVIVGKNFSAQLIGKVYHDYNNLMFLQYIKCYNVMDFLENCADPYGPEKLIAAIYNRGMNDGLIENILVTNRAAAIAAPDLLPFMTGLGQQYAEQISRITTVLDNQLPLASTYGTTTYAVPWVAPHAHHGFYNASISWMDISDYLDELSLMYAGVGVNMTTVKNTVQAVFNGINGGASVSFQYELGPVIDAIVLALPAFEPMPGLGQVYGNSGGNSCSFPTGRMEESTVICPGETATLEVFLTGENPWTITYNFNGVATTLTNINSSPYLLQVTAPGLYYLTYVEDNTGISGKVICDSVNVSIDTTNCVPLPVNLLYFEATASENSFVDLNWATQSEFNNSYFVVERSTDLIHWSNVLTQPGSGNSESLLHYQNRDATPLQGISYYRLKQVDFNGSFTYSDSRSVHIGSSVEIYPNPANEEIIVINTDATQVQLIDSKGAIVAFKSLLLGKDLHLFVSDLAAGMYTLFIASEQQFYRQKIAIIH